QRSSFNIDTSISINQTQSQNETAILSVPSLTSSSSDANPVGARLIPTQNKMNEIDHILDIKNRISKWWSGIDNDNLSLEDGTHYSFPGRSKRTTVNRRSITVNGRFCIVFRRKTAVLSRIKAF
ncbi:unnamed protein product, partial [Rotaria magnacalcarata]